MKLYIVQHGDALTKDIDAERPLSNIGHAEVGQVAALLAGHMHVSRVVHSGKLRAQQTADIFTTIIAGEFPVEQIEGIGPNDSVADFAQKAEEWGEDMLVVSHLPFVDRLVSLLLSGRETENIVSYTPGSICCLQSTSGGGWQLQWMIKPELL